MYEHKKILIADDDDSFLSIYSKIIEKAGFTAIQAHDGEEAILMATQFKPDLLVLDIAMPKKDGMAVTDAVRKTAWGADVPIIILTGNNPTDELINELTKSNTAYYLIKGSLSSDDFIDKIKDILHT
jgi:DNA-binding response OmpR family regulator